MAPARPVPFLRRYGVAVVSTAVVTILTLLLQPYLKHGVMALYFASVMVSAWTGGLVPGLVASALSVLATRYFFFPPAYSFEVYSQDDIVQIIVFSIVTILISALTHKQKQTVDELTRSKDELKALTGALEVRVQERTSWLTLLYDITRSANEAETLGQAFRFTTRRLCDESLWSACNIYIPAKGGSELQFSPSFSHARSGSPAEARRLLRPGEGPAGRALETAAVVMGPENLLAFPVIVGGSVRAVFECVARERLENSDNLLRLMGAIGLELRQVAERRQLQDDYADAVWQQQVRIAHELHDGLGQELTGLGFLSRSLVLAMKGTEGAKAAAGIQEGLEHSLEQIRGLARGVMPVEREPDGLMSALLQLASSVESVHGVVCRFVCPRPVLLTNHQSASQIYRIAQEALTNAVKHGKSTAILLSLESSDKELVLRVTDDGVGFPENPERVPTGSGLRIMKYRAAAMGATLSVKSIPPKGTEVLCVLPLSTADIPVPSLL
jgi:signal transduction histidine kinase